MASSPSFPPWRSYKLQRFPNGRSPHKGRTLLRGYNLGSFSHLALILLLAGTNCAHAHTDSSGGGPTVKICVAGDFETPSDPQRAISQNLALTALSAARDYRDGMCELASYPGCNGTLGGGHVDGATGHSKVETVVVNYGYSSSAVPAVLAVEECADLGAHAVYIIGDEEMTKTASIVAAGKGLFTGTSTASTSDLAQMENFPGVVRSIPDIAAPAGAIVSLFQKLGWDKSFFIHSDDPYGRSVTDSVKSLILGSIEGSDVGSAAAADGDEVSMRNAVTLASNSGAHVIVLVVRYFNVDGILFAAEEAGILGDGYAWLTTGSLLPNEALSASSDPDRVGALMTGMLRVAFDPSWDEARDALGGSLAAGGTAPLAEAMADVGTPVDLSPNAPYYTTIYSGYAYDMMWALCMGLDRLAAPGGPLEAGAPPPANLSSAHFDTMVGVTFEGTMGQFRLNRAGDRDAEDLGFSFLSLEYASGSIVMRPSFLWIRSGGVKEHPMGTGRFPWPGGREYPDYIPMMRTRGEGDMFNLAVALAMAVVLVALLALLYVKFSKDVGHAYSSYLIRAAKQRGPPEEGERVCLVVTDIQNSTGLWDTFPEAMSAGHAKHDSCLRGLLRKYCGYECCTEGDSFTVAFHAAEDAIEWCVDVQMTLMRLDWPWDLLEGGASVAPLESLGVDLGQFQAQSPWAARLESSLRSFSESFTTSFTVSPQAAGTVPGGSHPFTDTNSRAEESLTRASFDVSALPGPSSSSVVRAGGGEKHLFSAGATAFPSVGNSARSGVSPSARAGPSFGGKSSGRGAGVWRGLRVRMGIHAGLPDRVTRRGNRTVYEGRVERLANLACSAAAGGQVLMTGAALGAMVSLEDSSRRAFNDVLFVHLGNWRLHQSKRETSLDLSDDGQRPQLNGHYARDSASSVARRDSDAMSGAESWNSAELMEQDFVQDLVMVLPTKLRARCGDYHQPKALEQLSPGFFEAPPAEEVTIVFTFIDEALELYSTDRPQMEASVQLHNTCIRQALLENNGYECEEQSGNFLLAFHTAGDAVRFARQAQKELMQLPWDRSLLQMPSAARVVFDGELVLCGLRVKMGMTSGRATKRVPSNLTGRADFYGGILNHAARIAAMANGGQIVASRDTVDRLTPEEEAEGGAMVASLGVHTLRNAVGGGAELFQVTIDERNLRGVPMLRAGVLHPNNEDIESPSDTMEESSKEKARRAARRSRDGAPRFDDRESDGSTAVATPGESAPGSSMSRLDSSMISFTLAPPRPSSSAGEIITEFSRSASLYHRASPASQTPGPSSERPGALRRSMSTLEGDEEFDPMGSDLLRSMASSPAQPSRRGGGSRPPAARLTPLQLLKGSGAVVTRVVTMSGHRSRSGSTTSSASTKQRRPGSS